MLVRDQRPLGSCWASVAAEPRRSPANCLTTSLAALLKARACASESSRWLARPMPATLPFADLPQARCRLRVLRLRARPAPLHVDEVPTIRAVGSGGTGQPNQ